MERRFDLVVVGTGVTSAVAVTPVMFFESSDARPPPKGKYTPPVPPVAIASRVTGAADDVPSPTAMASPSARTPATVALT